MQGVVGVRDSFLETGPDFRSFFSRFLQIFGRKYPEERHHEPGIFALQAYDAVRTVGLAWNQGEVNSGRQLLESILKTDFDGLSGKIQFTQQKLEPATRFQIINIIGKGYRELGFWTGKGFSSSIDDGVYNSSMESLGHVIWPGDPWSAPRGWDLPTIENPLRIGVPNGSLTNKFVEVDYDPSTNQYNFSGFSVDVFNETAKHLKYSLQYKFVPFEGNYTDLVKKVQSREFDAAVGDIAITSSRCEYVDFTYPYTESGLLKNYIAICHQPWSLSRKFNQLVYNFPIRIPERFSLVIRSLLTQEGICFTLKPDFKFLEVAYPYVAKRLLTDPNPALRERLIQVLFKDGVFQWKRLENLITLAKENVTKMSSNPALQGNNTRQRSRALQVARKLDLTDTIKDGARLFLVDEGIRRKLLLALTEDSKLHVQELVDVYRLLEDQIDVPSVALQVAQELPSVARDAILSWSASVLSDR
ncbi:Uncharacterized aarF domain-containing protein kinase At4g31390, chloroplastic [Olea europaea subsp. europaea]|uniref:Uncharacterized aarF domain-containing protein kinase At4g31390, chloroplastic n=1 Tax=Olea europaea subsp. europaea TaxID=158383 RepID=A0A8S0UIN3_OLEEU|nr:Uncharacterized aarF domain-containing protein kinase At4g31390, chloroplastic [Olea europaea subsp. europaea]